MAFLKFMIIPILILALGMELCDAQPCDIRRWSGCKNFPKNPTITERTLTSKSKCYYTYTYIHFKITIPNIFDIRESILSRFYPEHCTAKKYFNAFGINLKYF